MRVFRTGNPPVTVPTKSLYAAYRRDMVATLCNAAHGRAGRLSQARAGEGGLLEALLQVGPATDEGQNS